MVEIILKFSAALLFLGSGYFFGKSFQEKLRIHMETLKLISEKIYYVKNKIYSENYTLPEALTETEFVFPAGEDSSFSIACKNIVENNMSAEDAWNSAWDSGCEKYLISKENLELIKSSACLLGNGDKIIQKENLENLIFMLEKSIKEAEEKYKKDGKLYIKLGLAVSFIISIFIW